MPAREHGKLTDAAIARLCLREREYAVMAVQERLRRLLRIGLHEPDIGMGQDQAEEGDLLAKAPGLDHRLAEVDLGMARRVMQRNEGLAHGNAEYEVQQAKGEAARRTITSAAESDAIRMVAGAVRGAPEVLHNMPWREKLDTSLSGRSKIIVPNQDTLNKVALWKRPLGAAAGPRPGDSAHPGGDKHATGSAGGRHD